VRLGRKGGKRFLTPLPPHLFPPCGEIKAPVDGAATPGKREKGVRYAFLSFGGMALSRFYAALICPERFSMRARGARASRARGYRRSR
jgi:hypothetical protein